MIVWESDFTDIYGRRPAQRARSRWGVIVRAWKVLGDFERSGIGPSAPTTADAESDEAERDPHWNGLLFPIEPDEAAGHTRFGNAGARR